MGAQIMISEINAHFFRRRPTVLTYQRGVLLFEPKIVLFVIAFNSLTFSLFFQYYVIIL